MRPGWSFSEERIVSSWKFVCPLFSWERIVGPLSSTSWWFSEERIVSSWR